MAHAGAGWMGGISHIRLVPMSEQEMAAAKHEIELPPMDQRLFAMLDVTDEIFWNGTAETEEDIHAMIWRHQQAGFGRIYWRCFGTCLDNSLAVPAAAPRWSDQDEAECKKRNHCVAGWNDYFGLARRFDPLKVAVEYGRTIGADVHAMVRLTNFNRPPYANFWHDHPEFRAQVLVSEKDPKTGARIPVKPYKLTPYSRVLSFAYPEVRTFYVSFFKQIASTGTKGILMDMLRHPPIAGYEPIVSEAFKKKYGKDMEPLDLYKDPLIQEHFSEYLRAFLVELRQAVGQDIEIAVRCRGPEAFGLRGKEFIEAGLINTIVDAHWYSGNGPRPTIDATVAAVGTKGKAMAGADHFDDVDPKTTGHGAKVSSRRRPSRRWRRLTADAASPRSACMNPRCMSGIPKPVAPSAPRVGITNREIPARQRNETHPAAHRRCQREELRQVPLSPLTLDDHERICANFPP